MENSSLRYWPVWLSLSLLAHGALMLALLLGDGASPEPPGGKGQTEARRKQARSRVSQSRVAEASQQVRRVTADRLRQKLETLQSIEKSLAQEAQAKNAEYQQFTTPMRAEAAEQTRLAMEKAVSLQRKAIADLQGMDKVEAETLQQIDALLRQIPVISTGHPAQP
jgi:hypothetical protein